MKYPVVTLIRQHHWLVKFNSDPFFFITNMRKVLQNIPQKNTFLSDLISASTKYLLPKFVVTAIKRFILL
ncbi:hypothetical protein HYN56_11375 [Flavobacterium crocinum]|uniref:Uncharacterized protein n=1 Tax=Flavobacterium crocinum TaxID=2183896 RepID=A0A2S1YL68_9FLAO|nr:hypothetical protein HYN56_11375 [Flavobacterium crocinum]